MREIKFRGKRVDGKGWVDGSLVIDINGDTCIIDYADHERDSYTWHEVIPSTVGQYTGLKDKNRNEIYEGDILRVYEEYEDTIVASVKWGNSYPAFTLDPEIEDLEYNSLQHASTVHSCEIIGNVFDNLELLNK